MSFLCACSQESETEEKVEEIVIESDNNDEQIVEEESIAPSKEEVYNMRTEVLEGLTEGEVEELTEYIKITNLAFEHAKLYGNFFENLEDPQYPAWNYFEKTGEIQVGWAFNGDGKYDESLGITYEEFLEEYGTPVIDYNNHDGNDFIDTIESVKEKLENDLLYADLENLIENMKFAMEKHDVEYVKNLYHVLHDMDYFLLIYSPEDVAPYISLDTSTVTKYYGILEVYK